MNGGTPKELAQARIKSIEKRYKSPTKRMNAVRREAIFWSDYYAICGLERVPEYREAIEVYSKYLEV